MSRSRAAFLVLTLAATATSVREGSAVGSIIDLGTLGGTSSHAWAINDNGLVVGDAMLANQATHAAAWLPDGGIIDLGTLGGGFSQAMHVNEGGLILGQSQTSDLSFRAFVWSADGGMVDLGTLGGKFSQGNALTDGGVVVGSSSFQGEIGRHAMYWTARTGMVDIHTLGVESEATAATADGSVIVGWTNTGPQHAFVWTSATGMVDIGALGGSASALFVTETGLVVGRSTTTVSGGAFRAFHWTSGGGMADMGSLGGLNTFPMDMNATGAVVGFSSTSGGFPEHAFYWTADGGMVDLGTLGGPTSRATAISDNGVVVGTSLTADNREHAFLWTPATGMIDLGDPGSPVVFVRDVNNRGAIVGAARNHAVLWPADPQTTPPPPATGESATSFLWEVQFDGGAGLQGELRALAAEGDRVFAAGTVVRSLGSPGLSTFTVRAYDAWNGGLLWENALPEDGSGFAQATAIAADGGRVFVGGVTFCFCPNEPKWTIRAYDAVTGTLLWNVAVTVLVEWGPDVRHIVASGGRVFAIVGQGRGISVRVFDASTGSLQWADDSNTSVVGIGSGVGTAVAADQRHVFVTGTIGIGNLKFSGTLRAYDADTGMLLWQSAATENDYRPATIAIDNQRVFTAGEVTTQSGFTVARDFAVRVYDRETGQLLWEDRVYGFDGNSGSVADLVTNGRNVYAVGRIRLNDTAAGTGEFAVRAYDAETGRILWMDIVGSPGTTETARAATLRGGQLIVAGSLDVLGTGLDFVVRTYDAETGELLWDDFVNGTANGADRATGVAVLPHAVYVGGTLTNTSTMTDWFVRGYYK